MVFTEILRRYKDFNPATGGFDCHRTLREYARVIGVDAGQLSRILNGTAFPGRSVLERLARTFPAAAKEITAALVESAEPAEAAV